MHTVSIDFATNGLCVARAFRKLGLSVLSYKPRNVTGAIVRYKSTHSDGIAYLLNNVVIHQEVARQTARMMGSYDAH